MSSTEMYRVNKEGDVVHYMNFDNSYNGAMLVWQQLGVQYTSSFSMFNPQPTWNIVHDLTVPESHRIVMLSTFDDVMIKQENLSRFLNAVSEYGESFRFGNLSQQARAIAKIVGDKDTCAICWNQTSVNCNPWLLPSTEGKRVLYNIYENKRHWFLFDRLDEISKEGDNE